MVNKLIFHPPTTLCSAPFYKIMVPTVDTVRYHFLVKALVLNQYPVLLTGPVGTGKTSVAQSVLSGLTDRWAGLTINMSSQVGAQTNPNTYPRTHRTHRFLIFFLDHSCQHPGHRRESCGKEDQGGVCTNRWEASALLSG